MHFAVACLAGMRCPDGRWIASLARLLGGSPQLCLAKWAMRWAGIELDVFFLSKKHPGKLKIDKVLRWLWLLVFLAGLHSFPSERSRSGHCRIPSHDDANHFNFNKPLKKILISPTCLFQALRTDLLNSGSTCLTLTFGPHEFEALLVVNRDLWALEWDGKADGVVRDHELWEP